MAPKFRSLLRWFPLCVICDRDYFALAHFGLSEPGHPAHSWTDCNQTITARPEIGARLSE